MNASGATAQDGDGLTFRGGPTGTSADLAALSLAALRLRAAGRDVLGVAAAVALLPAEPPVVTTSVVAPLSHARVLARAGEAAARLVAAGTGLGALAQAVAFAVAAYRATDAALDAEAARLDAVLAGVALPPALVVAGGLAVTGHGDQLTAAAGRHVWLLDHVAAGLPALLVPAPLPPDMPEVATLALVVARPAGYLREGPAAVTMSPPAPVAAPTTTADLLARVPAGAPGGPSLRVERLERAGGVTWVVAIAGTREWSPRAGRQPLDLTGNVAGMAHRPTAASAAVLAALAAAGARPGQPVVLVGHSQGGLVAAEVAREAAASRRLTVTHVVTAGTPLGRSDLPGGVRVLALEHADDLVPGLDGAPNPDTPRWLTARSPGPGRGLGPAHALPGYVATAGAVDASPAPAARAWREGLATVLGGPEAHATSIDVTARRITP